MVAVRASWFSNSSPSTNRKSGDSSSGNSHSKSFVNSSGRSHDASWSSERASSKYGPSRSRDSRPQKNISGIHEVDKNIKNNRNSGFRNGDPSILDKYNYVSNRSNLFSTGSGQNNNLPQENPFFGNSGVNSIFTCITPAPAPPVALFQAGHGAESNGAQGSVTFGSNGIQGSDTTQTNKLVELRKVEFQLITKSYENLFFEINLILMF